MLDLAEIRSRIDEVDVEIQTLITRRAALASEVAQAKRAKEENPDFYRPEREAEVLRMVAERNQGPLADATLQQIFQEIMSACLALQHPLRIAFLGPEGTYTHTAALKQFGHVGRFKPMHTIEEVFRETETGGVEYGIVPIENSTEGGVNQTLDLLVQSQLHICAEIELAIHHQLLGLATEFSEVKRVYAHPQALAQCRMWLDKKLPGVPRINVESNARAAQRAAQETGVAAIASSAAGERYQLHTLAERIEDHPENTTRFAVLGKEIPQPSDRDKTSLLLSTPNRPGALFDMLSPFADQGVDLTRIESRPSRAGVWDYVFFIDLAGHFENAPIQQAVEILRGKGAMIKHLGSYPVGRTVE